MAYLEKRRALSVPPFRQDGVQYSTAVTKRVEVADPVESRVLVTRDLGDDQPCLGDTNMDECLDLEAVAPKPTVALRIRRRCGV